MMNGGANGGGANGNHGGNGGQDGHLQPAVYTTSKLPLPPHLHDEETIDSLEHFIDGFSNYYMRDPFYGGFLDEEARWNPNQANYGQVQEATGLRRTAVAKGRDLKMFLTLVSSFMPNSSISQRLKTATTCIEDVWTTVRQYYGCEISPESLLDFANITKRNIHQHHHETLCSDNS